MPLYPKQKGCNSGGAVANEDKTRSFRSYTVSNCNRLGLIPGQDPLKPCHVLLLVAPSLLTVLGTEKNLCVGLECRVMSWMTFTALLCCIS